MVVGIIGVLAAVAIPAYQKYQRNAEINVVKSTLSQIAKAFPICLTSSAFDKCNTSDIEGTLSSQADASISADRSTAGKVCYDVNTNTALTGCIDFEDDGKGKAGNIKVGYPVGTSCNKITYDSTVSTSCTGYGCTNPSATGDPCDGGTTTSIVDAKCNGSGEC